MLVWSDLALQTDPYIRLFNNISRILLILHTHFDIGLVDRGSWNIVLSHLSLDLFENVRVDLR